MFHAKHDWQVGKGRVGLQRNVQVHIDAYGHMTSMRDAPFLGPFEYHMPMVGRYVFAVEQTQAIYGFWGTHDVIDVLPTFRPECCVLFRSVRCTP